MSIHNAKSSFYKFSQRDLSLNDYREWYTNVVEIATFYNNKLYADKILNFLCKEKHYIDWEEMLEVTETYADQNKELYVMAHYVTVVTGFLAFSDRRRYENILIWSRK